VALVRSRGLEPPRLAALTPQASASTNSATTARGRGIGRTSSKLEGRKQAAPERGCRTAAEGGGPKLALTGLPRGMRGDGATARIAREPHLAQTQPG
jgi:hypothetical protein